MNRHVRKSLPKPMNTINRPVLSAVAALSRTSWKLRVTFIHTEYYRIQNGAGPASINGLFPLNRIIHLTPRFPDSKPGCGTRH